MGGEVTTEGLACGHRRVLENLALGAALTTVLGELVKVVEPQTAGMICSVFLIDEKGKTFQTAVAPRLPVEFVSTIQGKPVCDRVACGTAALKREPVIVPDTSIDPTWNEHRPIANKFNLKASWSVPIISSQGDLLGIFAMYCDRVRHPSDNELQLIMDSSHIAAVAIEHARTRENLQRTISLLNSTIESTADGILVVDTNGKLVSYNKKFMEMWRLPEEILASRDDSRALNFVFDQLDDPEAFLKKVSELYNQPEIESFDVLEFKDGRVFERYSKPQRLDDSVVGRVWSFRDVTQRRRAELAAEGVKRAQTQFLANISHEIRTPVGAMLGFTELLLDPHQTEADRHRWAMKIASNGAYLLEVVNEILNLSKTEFGKIHVERTAVNFPKVLADITDLFKRRAQEKNIVFDVHHIGPIPQIIYVDRVKLHQILTNIIGNAVKFTSRGRVWVTVQAQTSMLTFLVHDDGVGIKPELTDNLFKPFSQADASIQHRFGGTGLGLALAQRLARSMGGDVVLMNSAPGIGSCFRITIDVDPNKFKPTRPIQETMSGEVPNLQGVHVLLIDDSPDNQFLAAKFLTMAGATVETANDGNEGFRRALGRRHDVVLMDIQMPEMDGYECTKKLRAHGFKTPIIALTAHAMPYECEQALQAGFDDQVTKPINRRHLIELVHKLWTNRNSAGTAV